jgi:hypothetical protein
MQPWLAAQCPSSYDAAFNRGAGEKPSFKDSTVGLSIEVLGKTKNEYKVRVNLDKGK